MGVVRREGDWRLEKREEGVYEVTFRREPQLKVVTAQAPPYATSLFDGLSVREVGSYSEVEGLFEEKAHGPPPTGARYASAGSSGFLGGTDLPPLGIGVLCIFASFFFLYSFIGDGNVAGLLIGSTIALVGIGVFGYAGHLYNQDGLRPALNFLIGNETVPGTSSSGDGSDSTVSEKTPPAPQKLKDKLFFERADRVCEYCEMEFDHPEVHHIRPRSEGGPNTSRNLIVLCPNCHAKADRGAISRSKLRYKVRENTDS